jgi:hypothetical protein
VYTAINGYRHIHPLSRKTQITLTDRQYAFLRAEAEQTGLALAELIRRAVDGWYRPYTRPKAKGFELTVGAWKRPDAAVAGRRPPRWRSLDQR